MLHSLQQRLASMHLSRRHMVWAGIALLCLPLLQAIYTPISAKKTRIAALNGQISAQSREQQFAKQCELRLIAARAKCVSGDPTVALHQYQQWLLRRAETQKEVTVSPGTIVPDSPLGWRVKIELEGKADLGWVVRLVEDLESLPLLHRVSFLRLQAGERQNRDSLDFALTIELMVCEGSETLARWPDPNEQPEPYSLARFLAERKPFSRGYQGEPTAPILTSQKKPKPKAETVPKIDPLATLGFVGTVVVSGRPMACVVDRRTQQEMFVGIDTSFDYANYHGKVIQVSADELVITQSDETLHWRLGENLRDAINRAAIR